MLEIVVEGVAGGKLTNLFGDGVNESSVEVLLRADPCSRGNTRGGHNQ